MSEQVNVIIAASPYIDKSEDLAQSVNACEDQGRFVYYSTPS